MPDPTPAAFISYSREDSEFALRLAQDLKAAGARIWLDQLELKPGLPWDNAIEDALLGAQQMLVILSPTSVKSENVRDEISYALRQGKVVIPVLYMECVVPLRLERKQHIDCRTDYAGGLAKLLDELRVEVPDQAVLDRAAESDGKRQAAWQAREEAQRLRELAERKQMDHAKIKTADEDYSQPQTRQGSGPAILEGAPNAQIPERNGPSSTKHRFLRPRTVVTVLAAIVLFPLLIFSCVLGLNILRHHFETLSYKQVGNNAEATESASRVPVPAATNVISQPNQQNKTPGLTPANAKEAEPFTVTPSGRPDLKKSTISGTSTPRESTPTAPGTGTFLIQVAGISDNNQSDIDFMMNAMRHEGFAPAAVRGQGNFVYIQIGPFSNRHDADLTRQRLEAKGYNPIIK